MVLTFVSTCHGPQDGFGYPVTSTPKSTRKGLVSSHQMRDSVFLLGMCSGCRVVTQRFGEETEWRNKKTARHTRDRHAKALWCCETVTPSPFSLHPESAMGSKSFGCLFHWYKPASDVQEQQPSATQQVRHQFRPAVKRDATLFAGFELNRAIVSHR
jgi:hypothetical protein